MRCSCCGNEIREDEKYCDKCGQNNEGYVERKPIEKVEIYHQQPNNSSYSQPQTTYQQTNIYQQTTYQVTKPESGVTTAAKVFLVIGTIIMALSTYLIGLAWCIPMTIHYFNKIKNGQAIGTGFKVCTLLFVSLLSGILMLCDKDH
ncbi:MAG: zinc ribbon domain-containing protein [Clostridia bacterium]|nr:zinc ribbon domain-containing protein [Clostridia bacterium]